MEIHAGLAAVWQRDPRRDAFARPVRSKSSTSSVATPTKTGDSLFLSYLWIGGEVGFGPAPVERRSGLPEPLGHSVPSGENLGHHTPSCLFPEWWNWDLSFTSHAELRMEQRDVTRSKSALCWRKPRGVSPTSWRADS